MKGIVFFIAFCITSSALQAQEQLINLAGKWKFSIGDQAAWASPSFDDASWETINAPDLWENQGFYGYDGYAWYRKKFSGEDLPRDQNLYLYLGYIDDVDEVYLNGKIIGFSGFFPPKFKTAYNAARIYLIPKEYMNFTGPNTLAVRIYDVTNEGGIVSGDLGIYKANSASMVFDLRGIWSFKTGRHLEGNGLLWDKIMVPVPWEAQDFDYDGVATYKKVFKLPEKLPNEDLVLLLGRIDDFDKTYFNGKLIGTTRDDLGYGRSHSYIELRAYTIPRELLVPGSENIITVEVEDIGGTGGIWTGPVGITTKTKYYRYFRD